VNEFYSTCHVFSQYNDIAFALFGLVSCLLTALQCCIYERGNQTVAKWARIVIALIVVWISLGAALAGANTIQPYIYVKTLGYVKVFISCVKYVPQAYLNYCRKATTGWSIGNVLLDFTGGILSILQMVVDALRIAPNAPITLDGSDFANVPKMLLGLESIFFDVLFMAQHYLLYPPSQQPRSSDPDQRHQTAAVHVSCKPWYSFKNDDFLSSRSKHAGALSSPLLWESSAGDDIRDSI
jgi:LCT (Lysosomal Cystine Transporter) family transporter